MTHEYEPPGDMPTTADGDEVAGPAAPRTRMTAEARRSVILDAARQEFARSGYHGASTSRIAAVAACSEPTLYKHFAGKQALFIAVLDAVSATMESQIDAVLAMPGDPIANWEASLPTLMSSPMYAEMVGLRKLAVTIADDAEVMAELQRGTARLIDRTVGAVRIAQELGSVSPDVDPEDVAWMWLGVTLVGSYRTALEGPDGFPAMLPHAQTYVQLVRDGAPNPPS